MGRQNISFFQTEVMSNQNTFWNVNRHQGKHHHFLEVTPIAAKGQETAKHCCAHREKDCMGIYTETWHLCNPV